MQYTGKIAALHTLGYAREDVNAALVSEGFDKEAADALTKVAFMGAVSAIGRGIMGAGKALRTLGGVGAAKGIASAAKSGGKGVSGMLGKAQGMAGKGVGRLGKQMQNAGQSFQASPLKSMGHGAMQAGQGMLFGGGKGLGGSIGKGAFGLSTASALGDLAGGAGSPGPSPQMGSQQPYGRMY